MIVLCVQRKHQFRFKARRRGGAQRLERRNAESGGYASARAGTIG